MKVIHLISGGDSGGAKTHVLSLLQNLNKTITAQLVCFRDGPFAQEARDLGIPTEFHHYPGLPHGFGLGTGTVAEGWLDEAAQFWEAQM